MEAKIGFKVDELSPGEKILSGFPNHAPLTVKHIHKKEVELSKIEPTNVLFKVPASHFGSKCPSEDLFISGHHRIFFQNVQDPTQFQGRQVFQIFDKDYVFQKEGIVTYYNIEVEEGKNTVFANGLSVETM